MRAVVELIGNFISLITGKGGVVRIEGKETKEARGRAKRLKEAREAKEKHSRTGNKSTD